MNYNIDFLIASLVILLIVLYHHYREKRGLHIGKERYFLWYVILAFADILLDILTTRLISDGVPDPTGFTMLALTAFYLLQVLVLYSMFWYTWTLAYGRERAEKIWNCMMTCLSIGMGVVIICNVSTGAFFYLDEFGNYYAGPYYLVMYYYAVLYGVLIFIGNILFYRRIGFRKLSVICELLWIMLCCVCIQAYRRELLLTGFGLGLGILVLFLTLNNPSEYRDPVTEVFNLQGFRKWVAQLFEERKKFHILAVEMNFIRQINQAYGFRFGDRVLHEIARKLRENHGDSYVFRISGNRFMLLVESLSEYERVRDDIYGFLRQKLEFDGEEIQTVSVICGVCDADGLGDCDNLLEYTNYLISLAPPVEETILLQDDAQTMQGYLYRKEVEKYLGFAIDESALEVYYQPVYSVQDGCFVSLEALSRLRHPTLGVISPEVFINIAEQNGQILKLGGIQFRQICKFISENPWLMDKLQNVKFNLSPMEIMRDGASREFIDTIREFGLPFSFFQFEITETVATEYSECFCRAVEELQECGIGLCLDDFGSGYANLNTVLKLPFSSVKLDRTLLDGITEDKKAMLFYQSIVKALKNMGYFVISEGVEQKKEVDLLLSWGVDMIQGFYYSKPLCGEALLKLLKPA